MGSKMKKDIEALAEIGEKTLRGNIAEYVNIYIKGLDRAIERNDIKEIFDCSIGVNLGHYLTFYRSPLIKVGLDTSKYDSQIADTLERIGKRESFENLLLK